MLHTYQGFPFELVAGERRWSVTIYRDPQPDGTHPVAILDGFVSQATALTAARDWIDQEHRATRVRRIAWALFDLGYRTLAEASIDGAAVTGDPVDRIAIGVALEALVAGREGKS